MSKKYRPKWRHWKQNFNSHKFLHTAVKTIDSNLLWFLKQQLIFQNKYYKENQKYFLKYTKDYLTILIFIVIKLILRNVHTCMSKIFHMCITLNIINCIVNYICYKNHDYIKRYFSFFRTFVDNKKFFHSIRIHLNQIYFLLCSRKGKSVLNGNL